MSAQTQDRPGPIDARPVPHPWRWVAMGAIAVISAMVISSFLTNDKWNFPFAFEIMYPSSAREVPERSRVVRTLFPGERDRGVMLSGVGLGERFSYRVAVVNGTGTSQSFDFNKRKDVVARLGYSFGAFDVGGSAYRGSDLVTTSTNARGREFDKVRDRSRRATALLGCRT